MSEWMNAAASVLARNEMTTLVSMFVPRAQSHDKALVPLLKADQTAADRACQKVNGWWRGLNTVSAGSLVCINGLHIALYPSTTLDGRTALRNSILTVILGGGLDVYLIA